MEKIIDCFFIGHNQEPFEEYERTLRKMGVHSGAYRDLQKNFIQYNNQPLSAADAFNMLCCSHPSSESSIKPIKPVETFNAAIAYLGTFLDRRGFTFDYVNSFQDEKEQLIKKLEKYNILTIAIITTLYVTPFPVLEIIDFIRKYNNRTKIIVGGPLVSTVFSNRSSEESNDWLKSVGADFYVNSSQGEAALIKIIEALKRSLPFDQIDNIHYKSEDGKGDTYAGTAISREENNLSENMVNWDLFTDRAGEYVNIRTGISCPFSCSFCGFPQHGGQYQTADVEAVEKELNRLAKIKTVKVVNFIDSSFNVPVNRFKDILRMMIKKNYGFQWHSYFRCQYADREMVGLMKESGCEGVFLGLESGSNRILKNMNKNVTREEYLKGIALLKEYGIVTLGNFIVGFPGETDESLQETVHLVKQSGIDFYRAQLWYCEPITPIWQEKKKYDLKGESFEWSHRTMDSLRASDLIDELIFSIEEPIRLPQYYFDYENVFQLTARYISLEQVKAFLKSFNNGIKEKLLDPSLKETSYDIIKQINGCCHAADYSVDPVDAKINVLDKYNLEFDF